MKKTIAVIEDNEDNIELLQYLLTEYGYEIRVAKDGEAGINLLKEVTPDLIICDIQLPLMNGYEVVTHVKLDNKLKTVPIIALTAHSMVGDKEKALALGFDGYISKPIDPEKFIKKIDQYLGLHKGEKQWQLF